MPRVTRRKSQKAGSCSYVSQNSTRSKVRKGSRKARKSQRAGAGCPYADSRRAGAKRSMRGGGGCHGGHSQSEENPKRLMRGGGSCSSGKAHTHDNKTTRLMRGGGGCHEGHNDTKRRVKRSRKARSSNKKRAVVMCEDGSSSCRRR